MPLNNTHFEELMRCYRDITKIPDVLKRAWVGRSAMEWFSSAFPNERCAYNLGTTPLNREGVLELVSKLPKSPGEDEIYRVVLEILAWGRMTPRNTKLALSCQDAWYPICRDMIQGGIGDPVEAYQHFYKLKNGQKPKIKGIGPAYYTKLIYFLCKGGGLIMDQWTARSCNILNEGGEFIKLGGGRKASRAYVTSDNDASVYKQYIDLIFEIATEINKNVNNRLECVSAAETEALIFSLSPSRKPMGVSPDEFPVASRWRRYVMKHAQRPLS